MARKRDKLLQVRLSQEEKQSIDYVADAIGMSTSAAVRLFVMAFAHDLAYGQAKVTMDLLSAFSLLPKIPKIISEEEAATDE